MPNPRQDVNERREHLHDLLKSGAVHTQQALVEELRAQGISATQSSVSRDLKELGAIKTRDGYALPAANDDGDDEVSSVADLVRQLRAAGPNMLVIITGAGAAQRVALALDRTGWPDIVGSIGGDDTVFVATPSLVAQKHLTARLGRAWPAIGGA